MGNGQIRLKNDCGQDYQTDRAFWISALMLAADYGWNPEAQRSRYLAPDILVSTGDARNMCAALETLFGLALVDPSRVFPLPVNMAELYHLKAFLAGGGFTAADPRPVGD